MRLGTSRAFVTKLLRTGSNMTLRTVADVFFALGHSIRVIERPLSVFTPKLAVTEVGSSGFSMTFLQTQPVTVNTATAVTFTNHTPNSSNFKSIPGYVEAQGSLTRDTHAVAAVTLNAIR